MRSREGPALAGRSRTESGPSPGGVLGPCLRGDDVAAIALGREAVLAGYAVRFARAATPVASLAKAHAVRRLEKKLAALAKPDCRSWTSSAICRWSPMPRTRSSSW